jgi:PAS domain S-box-containing protein
MQDLSGSSHPTPDFQALFESAPGLYLVLAPDFKIVAASEAYLRATMTKRDEILGRGIFEVFPDNPDDPAATGVRNLRTSLERVSQNRVSDTMAVQKYDIRRPESEGGRFEERYWSPVNSPVFGSGKEIAYIIHRVEDVTEFVRLKVQGIEQDRLTQELRTNAERMEAEVYLRAAEVQEGNRRLEAANEELSRLYEALRESEEHFRLIIETASDAFIRMDGHGLITEWNRRAESVFGWRREEIIGRALAETIIPSEYREAHTKGLRHFAATGEGPILNKRIEITAERRDGSKFPVELTVWPIRVAGSCSFNAFVQDITERNRAEEELRKSEERFREGLEGRVAERTIQLAQANEQLRLELAERKQLEEQLRQSQKMEAVGQLAGGVAHDFNNLLTIITGHTQLLLEHLTPGNGLRGYVTEIQKAGDRAASLTRQLLAFSRQQVLQPQVLDLNSIVANIHKLLRRLIGEDIDLVAVPRNDLGRVKADPGQLEQVIMNLAVNARDAMPQGGKLTIETANVDLDETYARGHVGVTPGPYVMLAVSDTGIGMDAATRAHMFEPFFTTKEKGKGTGLGLATIYGIVKQSGGNVWVYSELGRGTTFKIYLPRVEEALKPIERSSARHGVGRGSETVLIVEDEGAVRSLVRGVLEENGYTVLEAGGGEEALVISARHAGRIDLILTDVVMPHMSGRELAERLASLRPEAKVLYMSGYTDDAIVRHGALAVGTAYLQKPFTPSALVCKIREVLDTVKKHAPLQGASDGWKANHRANPLAEVHSRTREGGKKRKQQGQPRLPG